MKVKLFTIDYLTLRSESMGISADATSRAFPSVDIEAFMKRIYNNVHENAHRGHEYDYTTNHVIISVDPAGGGSSQFAIFSIAQLPNGSIMVRSASYLASPLPTFLLIPLPILKTHRGADSCFGKSAVL